MLYKKLKPSEHGQSIVEYAIILGMISLLVLIALGDLGHETAEVLEPIITAMPASEQGEEDDDVIPSNETVTINVWCGDNMVLVSGTGTYKVGDRVYLTSATYPDAAFVGWYDINGVLLSSQPEYSFKATQSLDIWGYAQKME